VRKRCGRCGRNRLLKFFNRRRGDRLQSYCQDCHSEANRNHYLKNRQAHIDKAYRRRAHLTQLINEMKSKPCADCGVSYPPYVMDFDHREGKSFSISQAWRMRSRGEVLSEIEKCDVVCANCHRERTYGRRPGSCI
jgi:hypothetical protein